MTKKSSTNSFQIKISSISQAYVAFGEFYLEKRIMIKE